MVAQIDIMTQIKFHALSGSLVWPPPADTIPQQDSAEGAFNKLARTFAARVEALKRSRTGGERKITVEHVPVNKGGQAKWASRTPRP